GNGTDFSYSWYSSGQAFANHHLVPLSRAADCLVQSANGAAKIARPCPLTDGNMGTRFQPLPTPTCPSGQTCAPQNNWIVIDIGFAHPLALLVLYDVAISSATPMLVVETSSDMTAWTAQATVSASPFQLVPLTGVAQFVRVRVDNPNGVFTGNGNAEIAIYPPGI